MQDFEDHPDGTPSEGSPLKQTPEIKADNIFRILRTKGYQVRFRRDEQPLIGHVRPDEHDLDIFTWPVKDMHSKIGFETLDKNLFALACDANEGGPTIGENAFWIPILPKVPDFPVGAVEIDKLNFLMLDSQTKKYQLHFGLIHENPQGIHYPWVKEQGGSTSTHITFTFQRSQKNPNILIPHTWILGYR